MIPLCTWIFGFICCHGCSDLWPLLSLPITSCDVGHRGKNSACVLFVVNHCGWEHQWYAHIVQCKYRSSSITAVSGLAMNLRTLRLLISIFYSLTDIIRGRATLQLGVSASCCCHAVIPSAVEDNKDSPSGLRGQHSGRGREGDEGKGRKSKRY